MSFRTGYAADIYEMLRPPIKDKDDDQLYYTKAFLDETIRDKLKIKLDHKSEIFQNLNGASADVKLVYNEASGEYFLKNIVTETTPNLIHGNGPSKVLVNNFGSYLAGAFKHNECQFCAEQKIDIDLDRVDQLPTVTLGLFIVKPTPFLEEFFESIRSLDYSTEKISIFIYNNVSAGEPQCTCVGGILICFFHLQLGSISSGIGANFRRNVR